MQENEKKGHKHFQLLLCVLFINFLLIIALIQEENILKPINHVLVAQKTSLS